MNVTLVPCPVRPSKSLGLRWCWECETRYCYVLAVFMDLKKKIIFAEAKLQMVYQRTKLALLSETYIKLVRLLRALSVYV